MKETDCRKCCVCAFKEDLCEGDFCEKYYREGNAEDFEKLLPHWIPCSERLPEIDKEVLVTDGEIYWVCSLFESPDIEDGLYQWEDNYGHWHELDTWIAWMPLPEPYKGGEQDG